jgi:hypothetical protein
MILHAKNTSLLLIVVSMLTFESGCIGLITHKKDVVTPAHQKGWLEMGMKKREVTAILGPAHEFSAMPTQHGFQETLTYYHHFWNVSSRSY